MWKCIFNSITNRGVGCHREPQEGEYAQDLHPSLCSWFDVYPDRYYWDGSLKESSDWILEARIKKLDADLLAIDQEVSVADNQPFSFNGNLYYPDTEFIQGIFSVLPLLPSDYTEEWKTAEKDTDGVKNKKVILNKTGIQGLALAYLQFKKDNWKAGELKKNALKDAFLAGE